MTSDTKKAKSSTKMGRPKRKEAAKAGQSKASDKTAGLASRQTAFEALVALERGGAFANVALANAFKKHQLSERDRAFVTAIVQGVTRNRSQLDENIDALSQRPGNKIDPSVRTILRIGAFQLLYMSNIPQQAVLNTATELAKKNGHAGVGKFTNGLLRNLARKLAANREQQTPENERNQEEEGLDSPPKSLAGEYSMPDWLVQRWLANFGEEETEKILRFAQEPPPLCIRVCELSITPDGLQEILERKGLTLKKSSLARSVFLIERGRKKEQTDASSHGSLSQKSSRKTSKSFRGSPEKLPGYTEGLFSIQDEAAAFVCEIVDAKPGELVVDLCAAPGGKSVYIAECMENRGRVVAVDQSASRLAPLKEARNRLGLTNIEIVSHDGRTFSLPQLADRVLVDAPCMGTGVINRRSDLRFRRTEDDLPNLIELQRELLANATKLVKPGGILVYATCSIEPEENFENAKWFLDNFEEFEPSDIANYLPAAILEECTPNSSGPACKTRIEDSCLHTVQLLPSRHGVSGFFIAKFQKRNDV